VSHVTLVMGPSRRRSTHTGKNWSARDSFYTYAGGRIHRRIFPLPCRSGDTCRQTTSGPWM